MEASPARPDISTTYGPTTPATTAITVAALAEPVVPAGLAALATSTETTPATSVPTVAGSRVPAGDAAVGRKIQEPEAEEVPYIIAGAAPAPSVEEVGPEMTSCPDGTPSAIRDSARGRAPRLQRTLVWVALRASRRRSLLNHWDMGHLTAPEFARIWTLRWWWESLSRRTVPISKRTRCRSPKGSMPWRRPSVG